MQRVAMAERPQWRALAESLGFGFHTMYGEPYWDERAAYRFSLEEIERDLEDPTAELHQLCLAVVDRVVGDEQALRRLAIPEPFWDWIAASWRAGEPSLYGRFDLLYDGTGPAKLLEYNADTPTSLYESAFFQWVWLEQAMEQGLLPRGYDQFNAVQDRLIDRFSELFAPGFPLHFASCRDNDEDRATVRYLEDCAKQAGLEPHYVEVEEIGVDADGRFADTESLVIQGLFKLYPWEMMLREDYGRHLATSGIAFLEPPWKAILSNKGILPLLWEMFPGHPNLLPAFFEGDPKASDLAQAYVRKPLFSREGANVEIHRQGLAPLIAEGDYGAEGWIVQAYHPVPQFDGNHVVIGSWIVGDEAVGIGLREDATAITRDLSRFVPHFIA